MNPVVKFKRLPNGEGLPLPTYETAGAAGMDLRLALHRSMAGHPLEAFEIMPACRALLPTGFAIEVPVGFEAQIRPRSGLALDMGLTVLNSPGTIDSDYRGEVKVLLVNLSSEPAFLFHGARIAQLVIAPVARAEIVEVEDLTDTERGSGAFGSTGVA